MLLFELRQRTGWLFLAVTIGHLVMISAQVTTGRGVPILEEGAFGLFAELQRASSYTVGGVQGFWSNYVGLRAVHRDNEQLRREVADLRVQLQGERSLAQQSRLLQGVLELRSSLRFTTAAATVIAGGASPDFRTVTIDKGTGSGVGPDMAVISPLGVVGRVVTPGARASLVQLLIDRNAAAGVLVERSRAQGVVVGTGTDRMRMLYASGTADITVGDRLVTSSMEGIYPKGFVVGEIESIQRVGGEYTEIAVLPAVEFLALETVLVALTGTGSGIQDDR